MADTFGIFREDFVPVLQGVPREVPSTIKGKARALNVKKKALGDVSNIVSQKMLSTKPNEADGKLLVASCSAVKQEVSVSCKAVTEEKETLADSPELSTDCKLCFHESDYDILSKSERLSEEAMELFTTVYPFKSFSPPCTKIECDLLDFSPMVFLPNENLPSEDVSLEEVPIYDSDMSDLSF